MSKLFKHFYEFGPFRIDVSNRLLLRDGEPLPVTPKAVDTLLALVQHRGHVLKRDDLMKLVWPDSVVEDGNLTQNIYLLRKTLGEGPNGLSYINTIPRRGYRFSGEVRESRAEATDLIMIDRKGDSDQVQKMNEDHEEGVRQNASQIDGQIDSRRHGETHNLREANNFRGPSATGAVLISSINVRRLWAKAALVITAAILVTGGWFYLKLPRKLRKLDTNGVESVGAPAVKAPPAKSDSSEAYEAYVQGLYYLDHQTTRILERSIVHFQQAAILDPGYAAAYAGMADCYVFLGFQYDAIEQDRREAGPKAKEAAAHALLLNDQLPEAHAALGAVKQYLDSDFAGAEREYRRAIELSQDYGHAHHAYAILLFTVGRIDEAVAEIVRAEELAPLSVLVAKNVADGYYFVRQYDQAIEQYRRAAKLDPTASEVHRDLGWAYACRGMHAEAAAEFIQVMMLHNASPERLAMVRQGYNRGGLKGFWRKWLQSQQGRIRSGQLDPCYIALVHAFLGDKDQALAWLQKASRDGSIDPTTLKFDPVFDSLRSDSRYLAILEHSGLTALSR
jgi:DNA-binding winged helix-turn-helix (wHTH) protein